MATIKFYIISCSSDTEMDVRNLYCWGEWESAAFMPDTRQEALDRIERCRKKNKCESCDAEIHRVSIRRKKKTLLSEISGQMKWRK
jgi:hypothetical protein